MKSNLLSLQAIAELQGITQNRLATGMKVNSAIDNPSAYYTSVSLDNRSKDLSQLLDSMSQGIQTLKAVSETLSIGLDLLRQAQAMAKKALETAPVIHDRYWYEQQEDVSFVVENARQLKNAVESGKAGNIVILGTVELNEELVLKAGQNIVGVGYYSNSSNTEINKYSTITYKNSGRGIVATDGTTISDVSIKVNKEGNGFGIFSDAKNLNVHNVDIQGATKAIFLTVDGNINLSGKINISDSDDAITNYNGVVNVAKGAQFDIDVLYSAFSANTINLGDNVTIDSKNNMLFHYSVYNINIGNSVNIKTVVRDVVAGAVKIVAGDNLNFTVEGKSAFKNAELVVGNNATFNIKTQQEAFNNNKIKAKDNLELILSVNGSNENIVDTLEIDAGDNFSLNTSGKNNGQLLSYLNLNTGRNAQINLDNVTFKYANLNVGEASSLNVVLADINANMIFNGRNNYGGYDSPNIIFGANSKINIINAQNELATSSAYVLLNNSELNMQTNGLFLRGGFLEAVGSSITVKARDALSRYGAELILDNSKLNAIINSDNKGIFEHNEVTIKNGSELNLVVNGNNNTLFQSGGGFNISADSKININTNGNGNILFNTGGLFSTEIGAELSFNGQKYQSVKNGEDIYLDSYPADELPSEYFKKITSRSLMRSAVPMMEERDDIPEIAAMHSRFATVAVTAEDIPETPADVKAYSKQYNEILQQFGQLINDAGYKGVNLLKENDLQIIFNEAHSSKLNVKGINASIESLGVVLRDWQHSSHIDRSLDELDKAIAAIRGYSVQFGNYYSIVSERENFTENLINVLTEGADKLTLADMNEESANMLALETRQMLAVNSLSLASQANQSILKLFY